jgi:hypothetical protein
MALFMFAKWWKFTTKKTFGYIIDIFFLNSKRLDNVYGDFKDLFEMFSNKFDVGIIIIIIIFYLL